MAQLNSSHSYLQQNYNVPTNPPPGSKFKIIKKFVSRCIAYFTTSQNDFNANVVRTLDSFHIKNEDNEKKFIENEKTINELKDSLKQLQIEFDKNNSYFENVVEKNIGKQNELFELNSRISAGAELLKDMQEHHGGVIAGLQKKIDSTVQLISGNQSCMENIISKINSNQKNITGVDNRQNDLTEKLTGSFDNLNKRQDDLAEKSNNSFDKLNKRQDDLSEKSNNSFKNLNKRQDDISTNLETLIKSESDNINSLNKRINLSDQGFTELVNLMKELSDQTSLLKSSLNNALSDFSSSKDKSKLNASLNVLKDLWNDSDYAAYENAYRGSDELITERLNYYLKWLKNIDTSKQNCVLDLGCGRGEFVELLNNNKISARGIDLNKFSVKHAKEKNIDVKCADIFKELKKTKKESVPAISAFHVIEHFNFTELQSFLQLAATRLKPGGVLLLETPNALNLQVAASDFYKDPTHVRPVHPAAIEFWLKHAGFSKVELKFIHPFPENEQLEKIETSDSINNNFSKLNDMIFGARDCAIIARK